MAALSTAFSGLSLAGSAAARRGQALSVSAGSAAPSGRIAFFVDAKQNALKRQRTSERSRQYNKDKKSNIATRIKKVLKTVDNLKKQEVSEADIVNVETLISEATSAIDKGIGKGVIKANTGARRKSRMSLAKQRLLIEKGLYTPTN